MFRGPPVDGTDDGRVNTNLSATEAESGGGDCGRDVRSGRDPGGDTI